MPEAPQFHNSSVGDRLDHLSYLITGMESYQRHLHEPEAVRREIGTWKLSPPSFGEGIFVTSKPLGPRSDTLGDTGYHRYEGSSVGVGNLSVTRPGSLTVTAPSRAEFGTKGEFGVVAAREDLSETRVVNRGYPEREVGAAGVQTTPRNYSGYERQWYVTLHTWQNLLRYRYC